MSALLVVWGSLPPFLFGFGVMFLIWDWIESILRSRVSEISLRDKYSFVGKPCPPVLIGDVPDRVCWFGKTRLTPS